MLCDFIQSSQQHNKSKDRVFLTLRLAGKLGCYVRLPPLPSLALPSVIVSSCQLHGWCVVLTAERRKKGVTAAKNNMC